MFMRCSACSLGNIESCGRSPNFVIIDKSRPEAATIGDPVSSFGPNKPRRIYAVTHFTRSRSQSSADYQIICSSSRRMLQTTDYELSAPAVSSEPLTGWVQQPHGTHHRADHAPLGAPDDMKAGRVCAAVSMTRRKRESLDLPSCARLFRRSLEKAMRSPPRSPLWCGCLALLGDGRCLCVMGLFR
jgi:hypothetical protein